MYTKAFLKYSKTWFEAVAYINGLIRKNRFLDGFFFKPGPASFDDWKLAGCEVEEQRANVDIDKPARWRKTMTSTPKPDETQQDSPSAETANPENQDKTGKKKKEYRIDIFRDWCKSCGICAAFCPRHCIGLDESGSPFVQDEQLCSGCAWCELHCPDFAISVRPKASSGKPVHVDWREEVLSRKT